jgi:aminoglycoside phosphotransferase family enzyme/predicted kinase
LARQIDRSETLIEALCSPRVYPHPAHDFNVLQTHISWVILTGDYAYKLKKPVDMGFLDFTTLERRRFYCQEELRLNRRLAPQLYLDVVPITGTAAEPKVAGPGEPIEYALRMRQFPQEALLSRVLARGELSPTHIDQLASQLAEFHGAAACAPVEGTLGSWETLQAALEETLADLELEPGDAAAADRLRQWCRGELRSRQSELFARRQQGFVRECHGDLHLGNMLLWHDQPLVFDCIEFNERFRWIDVLSDLAFAVMDLEDRGHSPLARRLLNGYLQQTGDYGGMGLWRYYVVYRAIVRAKVTCLRLRQMAAETSAELKLAAEYRGYLALAERFCRPPQPMLVIAHGFSGSGKTTLSQGLVEQFDAVRLRSDLERKRLFGHAPLERTKSELSSGIYTSEATERTYGHLAMLAGAILDGGFSVIVDAAFLNRQHRAAFRSLAERRNIAWRILDVAASPDLLRQRVAERARAGQDASEADLAVLEAQFQAAEPLDEDERAGAVLVNSEAPPSAAAIVAQLRQAG